MNSDSPLAFLDCVVLNHPLFNRKYVRIPTHGDGSCLFHSIALGLNVANVQLKEIPQRQSFGKQFRTVLMKESRWNRFIKNLSKEVSSFAPSYAEVSTYHTYADDFIYSFLTKTYKFNIILVSSRNDGEIYEIIHDKNAPTLLIAHLAGIDHFEPIMSLEKWEFDETYKENLALTFRLMGVCSKSLLQNLMETSTGINSEMRGLYSMSEPIIKRVLAWKK